MTPLRQAGIRHPIGNEGLPGAAPRGTSFASDDARRAIAVFAAGSALLGQPTEP